MIDEKTRDTFADIVESMSNMLFFIRTSDMTIPISKVPEYQRVLADLEQAKADFNKWFLNDFPNLMDHK